MFYVVTSTQLDNCKELARRDDIFVTDAILLEGDLVTLEGMTVKVTRTEDIPRTNTPMPDQRRYSKCKRKRMEARGWK